MSQNSRFAVLAVSARNVFVSGPEDPSTTTPETDRRGIGPGINVANLSFFVTNARAEKCFVPSNP